MKTKTKTEKYRKNITKFLQDIIRIPSLSCQEENVVKRIADEMNSLGIYDKVWFDKLGNVIGKIGDGPVKIMFDAHIDVVDIGDRLQWKVEPYGAKIVDGAITGRGATDEKPAMACMVYAPLLLDSPPLEAVGECSWQEQSTIYVVGSVMEEDCDGYPLLHLIEKEGIKPDYVILGEPTDLNVYRGHRGRMEITVETTGKSAHGAHCDKGENAIYKMAAIIKEIEELHKRLKTDELLGKGSVTISKIESRSPSLCAVADGSTIYLDRRLTKGETKESALEEIKSLPAVIASGAKVSLRNYSAKSWTGFLAEQESYFPTWVLEEEHPLVKAGIAAAEKVNPNPPKLSVWTFSTNGVATMGRLGIPTIGYAPSKEELAHSVDEKVKIDDLLTATEFYAEITKELVKRKNMNSKK